MTATTLSLADWSEVAEGVVRRGFHRLEAAISESLAADLMAAASEPWHALVPHEGGGEVYQASFASGITLERAEPLVRELANVITDSLAAALPARTPPPPPFNEVSWTRYAVGVGHVTAHRDPPGPAASSLSPTWLDPPSSTLVAVGSRTATNGDSRRCGDPPGHRLARQAGAVPTARCRGAASWWANHHDLSS